MCTCGDPILMHTFTPDMSKDSQCLNTKCDCTEYVPQ